MTDEEKIRKCIELVWDYEENYDGDDLLNFQNKELSTYTQHESVVTTFNKYIQLEKENAELKKDVLEKQDLINDYVMDNAKLEKENAELKAQIEKMKCCGNCKHKFEPRKKGGYTMPCEATEYKPCDKWELEE